MARCLHTRCWRAAAGRGGGSQGCCGAVLGRGPPLRRGPRVATRIGDRSCTRCGRRFALGRWGSQRCLTSAALWQWAGCPLDGSMVLANLSLVGLECALHASAGPPVAGRVRPLPVVGAVSVWVATLVCPRVVGHKRPRLLYALAFTHRRGLHEELPGPGAHHQWGHLLIADSIAFCHLPFRQIAPRSSGPFRRCVGVAGAPHLTGVLGP